MAAPRQHDQFPDAKPTSTLSKPRASRIAGAYPIRIVLQFIRMTDRVLPRSPYW
jgi:hypothetical protein